jgi:hypothetical protein
MKKLSVALYPRHNSVQQRAAAILSRPAKLSMQRAHLLLQLVRSVPGEGGNAEAGADKVDNDTRLVHRNQLASEMADGKRLGEFGKAVPAKSSVS